MLMPRARRPGVAAPPSVDAVARSVQGLLRAPGTTRVAAALRRGLAERQSAQVDVGDAGPGDGAWFVPGVAALCHRCAVGGGCRVAPPACGAARARRDPDPRRN